MTHFPVTGNDVGQGGRWGAEPQQVVQGIFVRLHDFTEQKSDDWELLLQFTEDMKFLLRLKPLPQTGHNESVESWSVHSYAEKAGTKTNSSRKHEKKQIEIPKPGVVALPWEKAWILEIGNGA